MQRLNQNLTKHRKKRVSVKTAIGLKLLTVFASSSIPDGWVWLGWALDTPLDVIKYKTFYQTKCHSHVQNTRLFGKM